MSDSTDLHVPTKEFGEYLARAIRHEARFAPGASEVWARRLGIVVASVTGTLAVLVVGLVFGATTGYASAQVDNTHQATLGTSAPQVSSQLSVLRFDLMRVRTEIAERATRATGDARDALKAAESELKSMEQTAQRIELDIAQGRSRLAAARTPMQRMPVGRAISETWTALTAPADSTALEQVIPTFTLASPSARTAQPLGSIAGVREVAGGRLLVNDGRGLQVRLFDANLSASTVALDSANGRTDRRSALIPFAGDSSLLPDRANGALRVLDGAGRIARSITVPDGLQISANPAYADEKGRLYYAVRGPWFNTPADSIMIVRVDVAQGKVDSIARVLSRGAYDLAVTRKG
ncbi:MAG TPA: hypothetical protein VE967_05225, partial [Gemmatimonadaceae bacterium]|nr:hypothetical protein [Gemmatimonadaceae bacterium]